MFFWNLSTRQASRGKPSRKPSTRPLRFEALESRTLLSVFTVDRLTDSAFGQGSGQAGDLRYCILSAVHDGDAITFGVMGTIQLGAALPDIIHGISIAGPGANLVTVSGNHQFRVFNIATAVDVTISGLTIADGQVGTGVNGAGIDNVGTLTVADCVFSGNSTPAVLGGGSGGGIYNAGILAVTGSTFSSNVAADGGGIANRDIVTVADSTFSNNSAIAGGGVFNDINRATVIDSVFRGNSAHSVERIGGGAGLWNYGTLTVTGSTFSDNATDVIGGGILNSFPGILTVSNSTFSGNSAARGGGLYNTSTLTITNSALNENLATSNVGGGIDNEGRDVVTVIHSSFIGNSAQNSSGGGIANQDGAVTITDSMLRDNFALFNGGGLWNIIGVLTVTNSTLTNNSVNGYGGGIANGDPSSSVTVTNSTLTNNSAIAGGGAIDNAGGSKVTVSNSTLSNNSAASGGAIDNRDLSIFTGGTVTVTSSTVTGNSAAATCGGLAEVSSGSTMVRNSIVAANTAPASPDVCGPVNSQGHNLIGDSTGGRGFSDTDLVGTSEDPIDPRLGPLQDHGGPTQTRDLLPGSPALNAGDPGLLGTPDQRGLTRRGGVNIGAYQASASAFVLAAPAKVTVGAAFSLTVTAVDPFGQVAVGYVGTVTFGTTDPNPAVVLPADYTFTATDAGVHSFRHLRLVTHGQQVIAVTDRANGAIAGSTTTKVRYSHHHDGGPRVGSDVAAAAADRFFAALVGEDWRFVGVSQRPQSGSGQR